MPAYSGLFNGVYNTDTAFSLQYGKSPLHKTVARVLKRRSMRALAHVMDAVTAGATVNGDAAVTYKRVEGDVNRGVGALSNGGVRTIETVTKRAASTTVTSAENTQVNKDTVGWDTQPSSYPTDASGNGGGGKLTAYPRLG